MATIFNPFKKKLYNLKYKYGTKAVEYFITHPICEGCGEDRIALLDVHHTHGKQWNKFKTFCNVCHRLEHVDRPEYTQELYLKERKNEKDSFSDWRAGWIDELVDKYCVS